MAIPSRLISYKVVIQYLQGTAWIKLMIIFRRQLAYAIHFRSSESELLSEYCIRTEKNKWKNERISFFVYVIEYRQFSIAEKEPSVRLRIVAWIFHVQKVKYICKSHQNSYRRCDILFVISFQKWIDVCKTHLYYENGFKYIRFVYFESFYEQNVICITRNCIDNLKCNSESHLCVALFKGIYQLIRLLYIVDKSSTVFK